MDELISFTRREHATERRFVFRAGLMRITVWAAGVTEAKAKAKAEMEADFRAVKKGWPNPKAGWQLQEEK
ncbi:hypothetical protein [Rhizobium leguminosarum]|uniref:hypothetical protein n=1 Tax=Rhizobium leguminosarum TaxID=384 RepID=UPI003D7C2098